MFDYIFNPYIKYPNLDNIHKIAHENGVKKSFKPGEILIYPYEYLDYCYFIDSGLMKVVATADNGKEQVLILIGKGVTIGAISILAGSKNEGTYMQAIEPTEVYKIPREIFLSLMDCSKDFHDYILNGLVDLIHMHGRTISNLTLFQSDKMLCDLLFYSIDKQSIHDNRWYNLKYNYTQDELANILGVSKSTLKNIIYALRDEGKIRIVNSKIEVNVPEETFKQYFEQNNGIL